MRPEIIYEPFDGAVEVRVYGKSGGEINTAILGQMIAQRQLPRLMILRPDTHTFNARICDPNDLNLQTENGVEIASGCLADGVTIPQGHLAWFQTADCPTIIARHVGTKEVVAAHAGRWSLIHEPLVMGWVGQRHHESVVEMICQRLLWDRSSAVNLEVFNCLGVGPINFRHPINDLEYGAENERLNNYIAAKYGPDCFLDRDLETGALSLHRLIHNQFCRAGVPADNIKHDHIDTAGGGERGKWFSRRGGDAKGHNTVLVLNRG